MNSDGTDQRQLTDDLYVDSEPSLSPDGRYVVFTSDRSGAKHIWRVNLDGRDLRQLTDGKAEDSPQCTPDGRWVVYNSWDAGTPTVWRVPAEGGQPEQIVKHESVSPAVSPDGRFIAYTHTSKGEKPPIRALTVVALEGGSPVREFSYHHPLSPNSVRWTADGRALTFLDNYGGTGRLWRQPVAGGAEQILAEFKGDGPYLYDWSPDGRQIALARGPLVRDIVLISDFR
jgi:Tol biopolymer transport system component